jgi:ABC-type polysaccharide/polyol phosphate export permease
MNLPATLVLLLTSVGLTVFCGWMGARARDYAKPRLVPWQFLMLLSAALVLIMLVGLLNELGVTTGANR